MSSSKPSKSTLPLEENKPFNIQNCPLFNYDYRSLFSFLNLTVPPFMTLEQKESNVDECVEIGNELLHCIKNSKSKVDDCITIHDQFIECLYPNEPR